MFRRIIHAEAQTPYRVRLSYDDGVEGELDFAAQIEQGGVFASMAEEAAFARVRIGEGGRYIEWPGGVDFCADALYLRLTESIGAAPR